MERYLKFHKNTSFDVIIIGNTLNEKAVFLVMRSIFSGVLYVKKFGSMFKPWCRAKAQAWELF